MIPQLRYARLIPGVRQLRATRSVSARRTCPAPSPRPLTASLPRRSPLEALVGNSVSSSYTKLGLMPRRGYFKTCVVRRSTPFTENPFEHDKLEYQRIVSQTMRELAEKCEELEALAIPGFDMSEKDGVFELNLGKHGTYVINKQAPNRQIWWSSPVSGPKRYNYDLKTQAWRNSRDGHFMYDLLNTELSQTLGQPFDMYTVANRPPQM